MNHPGTPGAHVLAIDIGASSGRAILGHWDGARITLEEVHRFTNDPVQVGDTLYWDVLRLWHEVQQGIRLAGLRAPIEAIGIDAWGVDFGLLDAGGALLENPVHYRDARTIGVPEQVYQACSPEELYRRTGLHALRLNTLYQLRALDRDRPWALREADTLLCMPDLFAYLLTGARACEHTIASTTQLLRADAPVWDEELMRRVGLPPRVFAPILMPGQRYGTVRVALAALLGIGEVPVVAIATHDTASAVAAVPHPEGPVLYLSCGTWSLMGTKRDAPCLTKQAHAYNLANEAGVGHTMLLRNIMGLWLVQESRRWWQRGGESISFPLLEQEAAQAEPLCAFVQPDDPSFEAPGDMPARVQAYCAEHGQPVPATRGALVRCMYESLALQYRLTCAHIEAITGEHYPALHVVGGGSQSAMLCQMTADALNRPVVAGPVEATALGNVLVQLTGLGVLADAPAARQALLASVQTHTYLPCAAQAAAFDAAYPKFLAVTGQG